MNYSLAYYHTASPPRRDPTFCSHHSPLHKLHRQHRLQPVCFRCACVTWPRPSAAVPFRTVQFLHFRHKPNRFKFRAICFSLLFTISLSPFRPFSPATTDMLLQLCMISEQDFLEKNLSIMSEWMKCVQVQLNIPRSYNRCVWLDLWTDNFNSTKLYNLTNE